MAPRGARGLFHPPPFWPKPDLPSTSSRSWPPGQRPCVLSLPGPLGMDCSGNRPFLGRANSEEGREGSRSCTEGSAGRRVPEWASKLAKTDGGVAQRVSVPGMGGEGTWSLEQEGPEECQASGLCAPSPSLRGLPSGGPGGSSFGETVRTQQLGTLGVAGMPMPQGLAFWVLLCTRLDPHALNTVSAGGVLSAKQEQLGVGKNPLPAEITFF